MKMAAAKWEILAMQMSWIMNPPGENPFLIKVAPRGKQMSMADFVKVFIGKGKQ